MRLLICAGGTGGGVYPALAVLAAMNGQVETLWVGGRGGMEADLVKRAGVPFQAISAAGVHGVGARQLPGNLGRLGRGYVEAKRVLNAFRPQALFFTGGYVAVPVALAGRQRPILLYVPDIEPGLALKTLARFADRIAVSAEEARAYFPASQQARIAVTGYPIRPDLIAWERSQALRALDLSPDLPTLLVTGGSSGARSLNRAVSAILPELLRETQVVHLTGKLDWAEVDAGRQNLPEALAERYRPMPYLHEMGMALSAADLALTRAGASTLGELPLFALPAILVPYPYAWRYQQVNAAYLSRHGAAVIIQDAELNSQLLNTVRGLLAQPGRLAEMRQAMGSLARANAANAIAALLQDMVDG